MYFGYNKRDKRVFDRWLRNRRERARRSRAAKTFRRNLTKALAQRLELPPRNTANMVRSITGVEASERPFRTFQTTLSLNRVDTEDLAAGKTEPRLFALAAATIQAALESFGELEVVMVAAEGVLVDRKGWEYSAHVLSVEATREVAESLNWDNLDERQVLESFDLRYAGGKQILAHGREQDIGADVAEDWTTLSPTDFERRIANLFEAMGYVVEHTGRTGDHGIDVIATSNAVITGGKLVIQCKRYAEENKVGESEVRDLYGAVTHERASKGILVTTSDFTSAARKFATDKQLELINGSKLAQLIETHLRKSSPAQEVTGPASGED